MQVCGRTGIPKNILGKGGLTERAIKKLNSQNAEDNNISLRLRCGSETDDGKSCMRNITPRGHSHVFINQFSI